MKWIFLLRPKCTGSSIMLCEGIQFCKKKPCLPLLKCFCLYFEVIKNYKLKLRTGRTFQLSHPYDQTRARLFMEILCHSVSWKVVSWDQRTRIWMMSVFGSACRFDQLFSAMKNVKWRPRMRLTDKRLEGCMRIATEFKPDI